MSDQYLNTTNPVIQRDAVESTRDRVERKLRQRLADYDDRGSAYQEKAVAQAKDPSFFGLFGAGKSNANKPDKR